MRNLFSYFLIIFFSTFCYAGIENDLLLEQYGNCNVRITHDATPDSETGTLIYRSYKIINSIHEPCEINQTIAYASFKKGFNNYLTKSELKPATSIMLGRLIRYSWASSFFDENLIQKTNHQKFNNIILNSPIIEPFKNAVNDFDYHITDVNCEKILYNEDNFAIDALCWLIIEK